MLHKRVTILNVLIGSYAFYCVGLKLKKLILNRIEMKGYKNFGLAYYLEEPNLMKGLEGKMHL